MASAAVEEALANGLDTVAAGGLVDLAATLSDAGRPGEAEQQAKRALALAEQRGALATAARAKIQLAAVHVQTSRAGESLADTGRRAAVPQGEPLSPLRTAWR